jgi:CHAT domain-containing protein
MRVILWLSCLCFIVSVSAQDKLKIKIENVLKLEETSLKIEHFHAILQQQDTLVHTESLGTLYHELGDCYSNLEDDDKAFFYVHKAIKILEKYKNLEALNKSRYTLASMYRKLGKKKEWYAVLLDIIKDNGTDKFTYKSHRYLGRIERDKGDFYKAISLLEQGFLNKSPQNLKYENLLRLDIITTYATKYESTFDIDDTNGDLQKMERHLAMIEKNAAIDTASKLKPRRVALMNNSLAVVYDSFKAFDKALNCYTNALDYYSKTKNKDDELQTVNNIGLVYSRQNKHTLAIEMYNKVISESKDSAQLAMAYNNLGYYLPNTAAKDKIPYFQKAIHTILKRKEFEEQSFTLPSLEEIEKSDYKQDILTYLTDLTYHYVLAFYQNGGEDFLYKAREAVFIIDNLVSLIRYDVDSNASKLFWIEKGVDVYMLAVEICYHVNDIESAFYFMEKNKALLLQEQIKTLQTKLAQNIPEKWLEQEYEFDYEVLNLHAQFQRQPENDSIQHAFTEKKKAQQVFMDSLQMLYPKYAKTKEKVEIVALKDIIEQYKQNDQVFVEYILHEKEGYGLFYDGISPILFKIDNVETFQKQLQSLRTLMTKRVPDSQARKEMQTIGFQLFQQLFPFKNALQRLQNKHIVIVADHTLQYIPFEIVATQNEGKLSDAYLINTTEISYLQSFSLFEQIQKKQNRPTRKLLAIAPIEFTNAALPTLADTTDIFTSFANETTSVRLQKTQATKENFLKHKNDFEIIHLNTHGGLDSISQTPWLAFYDSEITLYELYGLENQAELVVLDACKTDDGVHLSGEGIINLSRGFFFNGAQSVLASQWKVNEQAGNKILQTFYQELADGKSKSKALQLAKINYLQNHAQERTVPYYWATFKLTGSTDAVVQKSWLNAKTLLIGILILGCLCVCFYFRKKIIK